MRKALGKRRVLTIALVMTVLLAAGGIFLAVRGRASRRDVASARALPSPEALDRHCKEVIGSPRIEKPTPRVFVAVGYDLANTILVRTDVGNVVIDVGMSPGRARAAKQALLAESPGPVVAIILTHSHIDHVGGASVWTEDGKDIPIWGTEAFTEHFFKQYGVFGKAESRRGAAQFGWHVDAASLPCSSLGRRADLGAAESTGVRLPTKTFSGQTKLEIGGLTFELQEAHGETHDQLFVFVPQLSMLAAGDNYYLAYPNLYTIRGTSPRPVDAWIASLDAMRRLTPTHLVPSHTPPLSGQAEIGRALTDYRDGIQWVRDRVVQAANRGQPLEEAIAGIGLPPHLASQRSLLELYGQIDWSARAIYTNQLGWFDGRPEALYPPPPAEIAKKTVEMMGGVDKVMTEADGAHSRGDHRWALHLLALARDSGLAHGDVEGRLRARTIDALDGVASGVSNTNGRGYLLESSYRLRTGDVTPPKPRPDAALIDAIPLRLLFSVMVTRLIPEKSIDAHESVRFELGEEKLVMTVRHGVAELAIGDPIPGTPTPLATVRTDGATWRRLALGQVSPAEVITSGKLSIEGDTLGFTRFIDRFEKGL